MMYADHDEGHPLHDPRARQPVEFFGERRASGTIPRSPSMDAAVTPSQPGRWHPDALRGPRLGYRRGMNVNNYAEGYQVLREGLSSTSRAAPGPSIIEDARLRARPTST